MYKTICRIADKVINPILPSFAKPAWNHPSGPKTVLFWAPAIKWLLVAVGLTDLARPAEKVSVPQNIALCTTGAVWTRYCFVVVPINPYVAGANFLVGCTGLVQLMRVVNYEYQLNIHHMA